MFFTILKKNRYKLLLKILLVWKKKNLSMRFFEKPYDFEIHTEKP